MSILNKPSFFHYYLYDMKHSLNSQPKLIIDNKKKESSPEIYQFNQKSQKNETIEMIYNNLNQSISLVSIMNKKRKCSSVMKNKLNELRPKIQKCYWNSFIENQQKSIDNLIKNNYQEKIINDLILQSVTISPLECYNRNSIHNKNNNRNIFKINKNHSYNEYTLNKNEKKKIQKQLFNKTLDQLFKNEMIKAKTKKQSYSLNNYVQDYSSTYHDLISSLKHYMNFSQLKSKYQTRKSLKIMTNQINQKIVQ